MYIKTDSDPPWPDESLFYTVASNGLFRCRNHEFFTSSVPAKTFPAELAAQGTFLKLRYPKLPQGLVELAVGFCDAVYRKHAAEAAVLLVWDRTIRQVRLVVPKQRSTVRENWLGERYAVGVKYRIPKSLPADYCVLGDLHSHCDDPAYASYVDKADEEYRPGLHVVVGRLHREPPEFHVEAVVDSTRFKVNPDLIMEGYERRRSRFPRQWMERVDIDFWGSYYRRNNRDENRDDETEPDGSAAKETNEPGESTVSAEDPGPESAGERE